jgi:uroporphyrinogen decarboxylase
MPLINDRLIKALQRQPVDRTPIWIMRQAGRYLPEYRELRAKVPDFMTFCKTPELACEVTLQPLARFPLDAAIIFSDILTIPDALNIGLKFVSGKGPQIASPIQTAKDVASLPDIDVEQELDYVMQAIQLTSKELAGKVPLIGFAGSPWTVATYMVEGAGSKVYQIIKSLMYREPKTLHQLLQKLTNWTTAYLNAQIRAGANAIMLFDSWGGVLTPSAYQEFSLHYMQQIIQNLVREYNGAKIPITLFTKGGGLWLEKMIASGADALGLDWTIDIAAAKKRVGHQVALQGNLDPMLLFSHPEKIQAAAKDILDAFNGEPGHVFNLGHGIHKDVPVENVKALVEFVHNYQWCQSSDRAVI